MPANVIAIHETQPTPHQIDVQNAATAPPPLTRYEAMDRAAHAAVGKATSGLSPSVLVEAWTDWAVHMAVSPGKQLQLMEAAIKNAQSLSVAAVGAMSGGVATPDAAEDKRFAGDSWRNYPFNLISHAYELNRRWWLDAVTGVHGVAPPHEDLMAFVTGQMLDMAAPSNSPIANPDVVAATLAEGGQNLIRGAKNFVDDVSRELGLQPPEDGPAFEVGRNLAATPGKVVFRNELIELIQYAPTTDVVHPEPILIVPAWIMKFYILDLSPENSLVRYLVGQGFTVFMVSWKNPGADDRDLGMDDYRRLGIMDAIDAATAISGSARLHAIGYCLGGTLLAIAASAMARDGDERCASVTFLAAQIDFTEAGALRLFINDSQVTLIEDMMSETGFLTSDQMAGAFRLLRANDLIWSPAIRDYLLGESPKTFDLLAWNADGTRMPFRMHAEYLRQLFLDNDLAEGRYRVGKAAVAVSDIRAPIFAVGAESDHVAPWRSVYKFHLFVDADMTFVLTNGGHNAGIVSEPGHASRHFRIASTPASAAFRDPEEWLAGADPTDGSWWPAFAAWLAARSGKLAPPPPLGARSGRYAAICDAPGVYVMQK